MGWCGATEIFEMKKQFNEILPGSFVKTDLGYYLKPEQNLRFLKGILINLFTGELLHFKYFKEMKVVSHNEIMW